MTTSLNRFAHPTLFAAAAMLVAFAPVPTAAQSAEETVAFMLWGLEEGAKAKRVADNLWEAEGHNGDRSIVGIQRLTDCRFRVSSQVQRVSALDVLELDYILDFAAVRDYRAWFANASDQRIIVKIEGVSWYSKTVRSRATSRVVLSISGGSVDIYIAAGSSLERLHGAFAHFRHAFCRDRTHR